MEKIDPVHVVADMVLTLVAKLEVTLSIEEKRRLAKYLTKLVESEDFEESKDVVLAIINQCQK